MDTVPVATREALDIRLGDILDAAFVAEAATGAEVVFHLAALIAIPYSYVAAESFVQTNVQGTLNVLMAAKEAGVQRVVYASSASVYGESHLKIQEEDQRPFPSPRAMPSTPSRRTPRPRWRPTS